MSGISQKIAALQDLVQDGLADMDPRQRSMFIGLVFFGMITALSLSIWWMRGSLSSLEGKVADREYSLQTIEAMAEAHADAEVEIARLSKDLARHGTTDVSSFLEKTAKKVGISEKLSSVRKKTEVDDGILVESVYAVKLSRLDQTELARILAEVELSDFPVRIRAFKVRRRKRKEEVYLDVDMDISSFKLAQTPTSEEE
jgi:hypothetical protein